MQQAQHLASITIQLKHMELSPQTITITEPTIIILKISKSNSSALSQCSYSSSRNFIFMIEETDEQTDPMTEGSEYQFNEVLKDIGTYHLQCLNYPKIRSIIEFAKKQPSEQAEVEPRISIASNSMQNIVEVQEEQKQQQTKQEPSQSHLQSSHCRSDYASYENFLNDQQMKFDVLPNKYLKYFKEEFKLWRDFFETQKEPSPPKEKSHHLLPKQKYNSQREDNLSSSSLSFSEKQTQKEQSVISRLRSHQEISDINEEELNHPKTMKKTNSQYGFNMDREVEKTHMSSNSKKRPFYTATNSPMQRTEQSQRETFVDWASNWSYQQGLEEIVLKKRGDRHLTKQWFAYLHNKFKISQFMTID